MGHIDCCIDLLQQRELLVVEQLLGPLLRGLTGVFVLQALVALALGSVLILFLHTGVHVFFRDDVALRDGLVIDLFLVNLRKQVVRALVAVE